MHRLVSEWVTAEASAAAARRKANEARALALDVSAPAALRPALETDAFPGAVLWCATGSDRKLPILVSEPVRKGAEGPVFLGNDGSEHRMEDAWAEAAMTGAFAQRKHPPIPFGSMASFVGRRYTARSYCAYTFTYAVLDEDPRYVSDDAIRIRGPEGVGMADFDRWRIAKPNSMFIPIEDLADEHLRACMRWATGTGLASNPDVPPGTQPVGTRRTREWLDGLTDAMIIAWAEAYGYDGWCRSTDGDEIEYTLFTTKLPEWHVLAPGSRFGSVPEVMYSLGHGEFALERPVYRDARKIAVAAVTAEVEDETLTELREVSPEEAVQKGIDPILAWNGHHHWTDAAKLGIPVTVKAL